MRHPRMLLAGIQDPAPFVLLEEARRKAGFCFPGSAAPRWPRQATNRPSNGTGPLSPVRGLVEALSALFAPVQPAGSGSEEASGSKAGPRRSARAAIRSSPGTANRKAPAGRSQPPDVARLEPPLILGARPGFDSCPLAPVGGHCGFPDVPRPCGPGNRPTSMLVAGLRGTSL